MNKQNIFKTICAFALVVCMTVGLLPASTFVYAAEGDPTVVIDNNGSRLVAKTEHISNPTYQWMIADVKDGTYTDISGATEKYYDITTADEGKFIKVEVNDNSEYTSEPTEPIGKLVVFDIGKGSVTLAATCTGKDSDGKSVSVTHTASNVYVIRQEDAAMTPNIIKFDGNHAAAPFDVTLDGVNMGAIPVNDSQHPGKSGTDTPTTGHISIPATNTYEKHVTIRLKGENSVRNITYYNAGDTTEPQTVNSDLKITDINGDGATDGGSLYIPKKLSADEIETFVNTKVNYNHWNAGIGGTDGSSLMQNFEIAGGKIQVVTTLGDNCTAIGAGGNGYCQMTISGGEIIAHCNGTGAAIGGGIGWNAKGGRADVLITGGTIYAKNHGEITSGTEIVGGVAIGSGSSFVASGTESQVTITGGTIEAYGTFGNGIGGGNSSSSTGGSAKIDILGGKVTATSIGGGNSKSGTGGSATVEITDPANVTLSSGIGGGDSASGAGGEATVTVHSGTLNCGGVIGGGNGGGTGNGGNATITVKDGTLTAASIGGGIGSVGGNGGAAEISIYDGTIETGSIGGGSTLNTTNGKLGYAKAVITGGDITGQFLMAAGGTEPCTFTMSGGTLHGVDTTAEDAKYTYTKKDGAAVYMDDPNGKVTMTGGTITDCKAENGGAVYMTAGTFTIVEDTTKDPATKGVIENCTATENGGAVYLGGGTMYVNGGEINHNTAYASGGGAYINGGNVDVSSGSVSNNTATGNGGAIAVNNGNYEMSGGHVDSNKSLEGSGGGIYVSSEDVANVTVEILSGSVSNNSAKQNGGALAVVGKTDGIKEINVDVGVQKQHFDIYGNEINDCEHGDVGEEAYECPVYEKNHAEGSGGAIYVTGNKKTSLDIYCLTESESSAASDNGQSNFMKAEGGVVTITTSDQHDETTQSSNYGKSQITETIYVTGGQMDLWGAMTNPRLEDIITVDITKEEDHFIDHRKQESYYKLLYYENFTDPVTLITTGQYKEKEIPKDGSETISGNIYSHPGYTIIGWNTHPNMEHDYDQGKGPDDQPEWQGWYDVGKSYTFDGNPIGDLILYAIWEPNGYVVMFEPNVPIGETYSGTMENKEFTYDMEEELPLNQFVRPGYNFVGWATTSTGAWEYKDGQKVTNLTNEKGKPVPLYAVWELCDHDPEKHEYTYTVVDNGKTLMRQCGCSGYSETAALSAENAVYNKTEHPAEVRYSSETWKPQVKYYKGEQALDAAPVNAGTYIAKVTDGGATASVTYTIEKAEQPVPEKPIFDATTDTVDGNVKSTLSVKPVTTSPLSNPAEAVYDATYDSVAEYRIVYYVDGVEHTKDWVYDSDDTDTYAAVFELDVALTNYYIYARYSEGTNYKASKETAADSVYFYEGDVGFVVEKGEGILYTPIVADGADVTHNGITLKVDTEAGYYLPNGYDSTIKGTITYNDSSKEPTAAEITVTEAYKQYQIIHIPASCIVKVILPDARKTPTIDSFISEKQVFGTVTTDAANISKDSAYTVYFDVNDYQITDDPSDTDDYKNLELHFEHSLPVGTMIILQDKQKLDYYWTEITQENVKGIDLSVFARMGTTDVNQKFVPRKGDMDLQFVVDFSNVPAEKRFGDAITSITTSLVANKTPSNGSYTNNAPTVNSDGTKTMKALLKKVATFVLKITDGAVGKLEYGYTASEGIASKWDGKHMALVLSPVVGAGQESLPEDVYVVVSDGNTTATSYANVNGEFVIPLAGLHAGELTAMLGSSLFTTEEKYYDFNVDWMVSKSLAEKSPANGEKVDNKILTLSGSSVAGPSLRITGDQRLYTNTDTSDATVQAEISWADMPLNHELEVILKRKADTGVYADTGWKQSIERRETDPYAGVLGTVIMDIPLAGQSPGSYCIEVTADLGLVTITKARFYFILE